MFKRLVVGIVQILVRLRYRVKVEGLQELEKCRAGKKGVLFLPNHIAEIDPVILMSVLWPKFHPHPVVVDDYFYGKGLGFFMRVASALPCPNMEHGVNHWKIRQLDKLLDAVSQGLSEGQNYLIYPSGKLKVDEKEVIGGASFVPNLLQKEIKPQVVLVRIAGLWGSRFSCALTGKSPDFGSNLLASFWILLKNVLFFTPKRPVTIEIAPAPEDFPYQADRSDINRYLENWYNAKPDPLTLVSYSCWKEELPQVVAEESVEGHKTTAAGTPPEVAKTISEKISEIVNIPPDQITADKQLIRDLGLDSLDIAQLVLFLDEKYHVGQLEMEFTSTVGDLLQAAAAKQAGGEPAHVESLPTSVKPLPGLQEKERAPPLPPHGKTIMEAFLRTCDRMPGSIACMDGSAGILHYRKVKTAVLLLADAIRKMPGKNIGVLLPSSAGAYIVILAILCAGKVPVMLNWTVGAKAVEHAMAATGMEVVLSSRRFLNRLKTLEIGKAEDLIVLLEDVRSKIGLAKKLHAVARSYQPASTLLKRLGLDNADPLATAVILFTSGTEALPKGVPLSHANILSNQAAAMQVAGLQNSDLLYGVLPPFHSFGFSVTGILPLVTGLKVFYAPDPTNHRGMVRDLKMCRPTLFCCAPTFIRSVFHAAAPEDLSSLRMVVTGAEKAGKDLFDYVKRNLPNTQILEGYGITECSPIVTLCRPYQKQEGPREGVGLPLPGVELLILGLETGEPCPAGKDGEVCIAGPGVFAGYLGTSKNPFIEKEGKRWYRSGDIGHLTSDGSLVLSGRLKRFVKIGGEMVSLGGMEEEIGQIAKEKGWVAGDKPELALCSIEKEGHKTTLVLFATRPVDKEAINSLLKQRGHSNLTRITEVRTVPEIPLTGTGKTNYRLLEETFA